MGNRLNQMVARTGGTLAGALVGTGLGAGAGVLAALMFASIEQDGLAVIVVYLTAPGGAILGASIGAAVGYADRARRLLPALRASRHSVGKCVACEYDLIGLDRTTNIRCPECGEVNPPSMPEGPAEATRRMSLAAATLFWMARMAALFVLHMDPVLGGLVVSRSGVLNVAILSVLSFPLVHVCLRGKRLKPCLAVAFAIVMASALVTSPLRRLGILPFAGGLMEDVWALVVFALSMLYFQISRSPRWARLATPVQ